MMKYLIFGGTGFLGSHLVESSEGDITVVDDLSTVKYLELPPNVKLIKDRVETFKTNGKFDFVIHLAARPSPETLCNTQ
jgi:UDP-glucuronate decarboxylase